MSQRVSQDFWQLALAQPARVWIELALASPGISLAYHEQRRRSRGGSLLADLQNKAGVGGLFEPIGGESPAHFGGDIGESKAEEKSETASEE